MPRVYVSIGSNIDPDENIRSGVFTLKKIYPEFTLSSVYRSKAVGFDGEDFYNLVAGFKTDSGVYTIVEQLKRIEDQHNRTRDHRRFSSRTLDIDLLLYDDMVISERDFKIPRDEITKFAFVLHPLAEIAGQLRHPVTGKTYEVLWRDFKDHSQQLQRIDFEWRLIV